MSSSVSVSVLEENKVLMENIHDDDTAQEAKEDTEEEKVILNNYRYARSGVSFRNKYVAWDDFDN